MNFESAIANKLDKCRVRVYNHQEALKGGTHPDSSATKYKWVDGVVADDHGQQLLDEKMLAKVLGSERKDQKVHLFRVEANGAKNAAELALSRVWKDRSVCHLLFSVSGISHAELASFVQKMHKSYGYGLYAVSSLQQQPKSNKKWEEEEGGKNEGEGEEEEELGGEEKPEIDGQNEEKQQKRQKRRNAKNGSNNNNYTLSFIAKACQKSYGLKNRSN